MKRIGELALLYSCTARSSKRPQELQLVQTFLLNFLARSDISQLAQKRPSSYNAYALPYLFVRAAGHRLTNFEDALDKLHGSGAPLMIESVPYRTLEIAYALRAAGLTQAALRTDGYGATTLGRRKNPVYLLEWEVYSITHTLFYLSDFGRSSLLAALDERDRVSDLLTALLVHFWRKNNWDIVGELLFNLICIDSHGVSCFDLCMHAYLRAWQDDGVLPGPTFSADRKPMSDDYVFDHCYHTTLVGLLLCGIYLERVALDQ